MERAPVTSPYCVAAILAAFSRASDDPVCGAAPVPALADRDRRSPPVQPVLHRLLDLLGTARGSVCRPRPDERPSTGGSGASADPVVPAAHRDQPAPALASHFDFCQPADPTLDWPQIPDRRAA